MSCGFASGIAGDCALPQLRFTFAPDSVTPPDPLMETLFAPHAMLLPEWISTFWPAFSSTLFATIPSAIGYFKSGKLRPLGVSSAKRNSALPELPTVAEAGVPGYEAIEWQGVMVPTGTPRDVIAFR